MSEFCDLSAVELRRLIGTKAVSPVELLASCRARIAAVNPALNAITTTCWERAEAEAAKAAGLDNLRQIGIALIRYASEGDKTLPPMDDLAATQKALRPYARGADIFFAPGGKEPYQPNASLASKKLIEIEDISKVIVFYESTPSKEGRAALFLDGHVEKIPPDKCAPTVPKRL